MHLVYKAKKIHNSKKEKNNSYDLTEISWSNAVSTFKIHSSCLFWVCLCIFMLNKNRIFCSITFLDRIWTEPSV